MKSFEHFTRSKALKSRVSLDTASDVEPDDVTPESGKFGHRKVASQGCEGAGVPAAAASRAPSAPAPAEGGSGEGSLGPLLAEASLGAPGGRMDPVVIEQEKQMCFQPSSELVSHQYEANLPLSDSGVPGGPPPDAAAGVGERPTSSAARRPSTPRTRATYTQKPYTSMGCLFSR